MQLVLGLLTEQGLQRGLLEWLALQLAPACAAVPAITGGAEATGAAVAATATGFADDGISGGV